MHRLQLPVVLAWLIACGGEAFAPRPYELQGGAPVRIEVPEGPHRPGTLVDISVRNGGDREYVWNPCMRTLELQTDDGWTPVQENDRWCTLEGWILKSGGHTDASTDIPGSVSAGVYRFHYSFSREEGDSYASDEQVSNPFGVSP
jgi:hypothetical protein